MGGVVTSMSARTSSTGPEARCRSSKGWWRLHPQPNTYETHLPGQGEEVQMRQGGVTLLLAKNKQKTLLLSSKPRVVWGGWCGQIGVGGMQNGKFMCTLYQQCDISQRTCQGTEGGRLAVR